MKKLPENFTVEKYGLKVRLVNVYDAEFIVSLRSDPERTKFMVTLSEDLENQRQWIREYKKREEEGSDYYLIYSDHDGSTIGVNRISKINFETLSCKLSGFIKKKGNKADTAAMFLIQKEIVFDTLGLLFSIAEIHEKNYKMLKYWEYFNYKIAKNENNFLHLVLTKVAFQNGKLSFIEKQIPHLTD